MADIGMILMLRDWGKGYDRGRREHNVSVGQWDLREPGLGNLLGRLTLKGRFQGRKTRQK